MAQSSDKQKLVNELHKPARVRYQRRKVVMKGIDDLWQIDLVEMQNFSKTNKGFRYLLTVIDTFSKYAWAVPVKAKTGKEVSDAFESILKASGRKPKNCQSDLGKEFYNKYFQSLMTKNKINHYSTYSTMKASICERFNRTLKTLMWKEFSLQGNHKWLHLIQKLLNIYNNTKHRTIKIKPSEVNIKNEKQILKDIYTVKPKEILKTKFKVDDFVRVSKQKSQFAKGYTQNWSNELFKIFKVQKTLPPTYLLRDADDQEISGSFYEEELQKTYVNNLYFVEKIVRKLGDKALVKWVGYNNNHNSWVKIKDLFK